MRLLTIFLRVWGVVSIAIFGFIFIGYALHTNAFRPGAALHWAVFLLLAARRPTGYTSFLNFTMWANLVHGLVMVPGASEHGYHGKFLTDIPWILVLAAAIYFLRPRSDVAVTDVARSSAVA